MLKHLRCSLAAAMLAALCLAPANLSSDAPKPAGEVLKVAGAKAKANKKSVMVIFHASWCGWCHRFDKYLADPAFGDPIKKNFEIVHLVVQESPDKKALENPGGAEVQTMFGGKDAGLPFMAVTDASGKLLANSNAKDGKSGNIGCPVTDEEIAHFLKMLERSAPRISAEERARLGKWLKANAPKSG